MNYRKLGYSANRIAVANIDKLSFHRRGSTATYTPFGLIKLCKVVKGVRRFSVSKSKCLHNGGSYTMKSLRKRIMGMRKRKARKA